MDYNQNRLGENIRALRKSTHLSLNELADIIGVAPTHIGNIERGVRKPRIETLCALSAFFEISIDDLLSLDLTARETVAAREVDSQDLYLQIEEFLHEATAEELALVYNVLRDLRRFSKKEDAEDDDTTIKY